jgi:hydroxymethylpyrimidine pyrophosphatase-like HAD family hydrolase
VVVSNGALVKDLASAQTLQQCYLAAEVYQQALGLLRQLAAPMLYIDAFPDDIDILTEAMEHAHPFQREYLQDNLAHCQIVSDIGVPPSYGVLLLGIMADEPSLGALYPAVIRQLGSRARVHLLTNKNYQGYILEILPPTVSKWQALWHWAAGQGIACEEIMAIGDDHNDLDMIRHAGLGIAMGNAAEAVKAVADHVTGSNAEDGLLQALERFVLRPQGTPGVR